MAQELTKDQHSALLEVRKALYERLRNFSFTEDMLKDKSLFQMLNLIQLLIGHRNYIGMFSHTCAVLEGVFGADAFWDKPLKSDLEQIPGQKSIVN
jgi:hypothetical protein